MVQMTTIKTVILNNMIDILCEITLHTGDDNRPLGLQVQHVDVGGGLALGLRHGEALQLRVAMIMTWLTILSAGTAALHKLRNCGDPICLPPRVLLYTRVRYTSQYTCTYPYIPPI
jgi:hypothetical protein